MTVSPIVAVITERNGKNQTSETSFSVHTSISLVPFLFHISIHRENQSALGEKAERDKVQFFTLVAVAISLLAKLLSHG